MEKRSAVEFLKHGENLTEEERRRFGPRITSREEILAILNGERPGKNFLFVVVAHPDENVLGEYRKATSQE